MDQQSKHSISSSVLITIALLVGIVVGLIISYNYSQARLFRLTENFQMRNNKIDMALALIDRYYVDSVETDSLVEQLLPDLMWYLDPHSIYIPASELTALNEPLDGEFDGIGVTFNMATDTIVVLNVIPQGPSQKAGIQNGDRIIRINDSLVAGQQLPIDEVMKMLRGKRGTKVTLSIQRQHASELLPITVTRDKIPMKSVNAACMLTPDVGFLRITSFSQHTYDEMTAALAELKKRGMTKLILDLRGNSGGYLGQSILMANEFLPAERLIVYTEDRDGNRMEEYSDGRGRYRDVELAVLIDEQSASSSEIFAGALQDNDRATIVGRRSFGKGLVQQQIPFPDGSAIRLTTARYYTPTGRSIQKPYTGADEEYDYDLYNRYLHNELFSADSIRFDDSLRYVTPGGRIVYGGGGIMPDEFVPLDTTAVSDYYLDVAGQNLIYSYAMDYSDRHRKAINAVRDIKDLNALLDRGDLLADFVAFADRHGVAPIPDQIRQSETLLRAILRGLIGRNTPLEESGFYANYYVADPTILRALAVFGEQAAAD